MEKTHASSSADAAPSASKSVPPESNTASSSSASAKAGARAQAVKPSDPSAAGAADTVSASVSAIPSPMPKVGQYNDGLGRAPALASLTLRVRNLSASTSFYRDVMGMRCVLHQPKKCALVGWPGRGAMVTLIQSDPDLHNIGWTEPDTRRDAYVWLGLANLDNAEATLDRLTRDVGPRARARLQGLLVGDTGKIATVGHFRDPDGYALEALQAGFLSLPGEKEAAAKIQEPLAAKKPVFGQLKVNVKDPETTLKFYVDGLGMRLVSRMAMTQFGLTLYFLAFTAEDIPTPLDSETNRQWLWTRQFTQLELQYWHGFEPSVALRVPPIGGGLGFAGFDVWCEDVQSMANRLCSDGIGGTLAPSEEGVGLQWKATVTVVDPDGRRVRLVSR